MTSGVHRGTDIGVSLCSTPEEMSRERVSIEPTFVCACAKREFYV